MRKWLCVLTLAAALGLAAGCTPEQDESLGNGLTSTGQTIEKVRVVTKLIPGPEGAALDGVLAGLSALLLAGGAYMTKKASARKAKEKVLRGEMTKEQRVAADKKIYGKKFDPKLSK